MTAPTPEQTARDTATTLTQAQAMTQEQFDKLIPRVLNDHYTDPWPVLCRPELIYRTWVSLYVTLRRVNAALSRRARLAALNDETAYREMRDGKQAAAERFQSLVCARLDYVTAAARERGDEDFPSWADTWNLDVTKALIDAVRRLRRLDCDETSDEEFDQARDALYALADDTARLAVEDGYLAPVPLAA